VLGEGRKEGREEGNVTVPREQEQFDGILLCRATL
jgi:hypothetical protein